MSTKPDTDTDLQEKVLEWLRNEGYPVEFRAAQILSKAGFWVRQGYHYRDESLPREIDVLAQVHNEVADSFLRVTHAIECKWTRDNPWVVLSSEHARIAPQACIAQTLGNRLGTFILARLADDPAIQQLRLFQAPKRAGFNGHRALTTAGKDHFYAAMQSVVTATKIFSDDSNRPGVTGKQSSRFIEVGFPVLVIAGRLFEAFFDEEQGEMKVIEQSDMRLHWRGAQAWELHSSLDVVTIDALPQFAAARLQDSVVLIHRMSDHINEAREHDAHISKSEKFG